MVVFRKQPDLYRLKKTLKDGSSILVWEVKDSIKIHTIAFSTPSKYGAFTITISRNNTFLIHQTYVCSGYSFDLNQDFFPGDKFTIQMTPISYD